MGGIRYSAHATIMHTCMMQDFGGQIDGAGWGRACIELWGLQPVGS